MRIVIGADHAGLMLKDNLREFLVERGDHVQDVGTFTEDPVDYPDYALAVADSILNGGAERRFPHKRHSMHSARGHQ